jgi:LacI family transcriptional regulator
MALVGFDDIPEADLLEPGVTLVTQDAQTMGERAAQLLFDRMAGENPPFQRVVVPTQLTPRGSGEITPEPRG